MLIAHSLPSSSAILSAAGDLLRPAGDGGGQVRRVLPARTLEVQGGQDQESHATGRQFNRKKNLWPEFWLEKWPEIPFGGVRI